MAELYYGVKDRKELLNRLIEINLIYQFLVQKGIDIPDEKVDEIVQQIAKANGMTPQELARELSKYGLTLQDFREFVKKELIATEGLREYLRRKVELSEIELELAKLKEGKVKTKKRIELVTILKDKGKELLREIESGNLNLKELAEKLGGEYQSLEVEKGDLIKELDEQVWKSKEGDVIFAEDKDQIYVVKVGKILTEVSGVNEEELKRKILAKKFQEEYEKLLKELKKNSVITILE
ncbi:SurA N-terminal domain-containing protein [Aquifex aeolicus]|uniref:SurA N-terminal domain-containing protein n=1 Tax=Aquifex aeolicus (strain VF5) TaxID=224324 RepID=O67599_AQUAE|nr:SurA N-terminal domain-containing protein [Aquifex aeolicus]AAC07564.1 hypothetical protein aq_1694 [Aquifex aeolicus VF5]